MAKNNNKGFSLVEIVVAVAILSMLLSPILIQIAQTVKKSADAKEKQHVVENADYVLQTFQSAEMKDLNKSVVTTVGDLSVTSMVKNNGTSASISCEISDYTSSTTKTVSYDATTYSLSDVKLGKEQNTYARTVMIDDLNNKLLEAGYRAKIFTESEKAAAAAAGKYSDYTYTNDGTCVKYDANKHVVAIVAEKTNTAYTDPNIVNMGSVQNLDTSKVAIIQGVASNFDAQAENDFYSLKMQHLKQYNYPAYEQAMGHVLGDNIFSSNSFAETTNKLTLIKTEKKVVGTSECYIVNVYIYYTDSYSIPTEAGGRQSFDDKLSYNVFSQKFYTDRAPDVYFMYEPFVAISTKTNVQYSTHDYIAIDNDVDTKDAKVFVIKPDENQLAVKGVAYSGSRYLENVYYTRATGAWKPVTVDFVWVGTCDGASNPLDVYTNLEIDATNSNAQNIVTDSTAFNTALLSLASGELSGAVKADYFKTVDGHNYTVHMLKDDTNTDGRLYRTTVLLQRRDLTGGFVSGYDVMLTGSKGAD